MGNPAQKLEFGHLSEAKLRRALRRYIAPRFIDELLEELASRKVDPRDIRLTDEDRVRIAKHMKARKKPIK